LPLAAHQQKIVISSVTINPRTQKLELVHQVPVHDAEHALRTLGTKAADIIGRSESREAFARYVTRRFVLALDGAPVTHGYVGSEIIGGSLYVYQEAPAPAAGARVRVHSQILTDVWARQRNRVNLGRGSQVKTFIFAAGDAAQESDISP